MTRKRMVAEGRAKGVGKCRRAMRALERRLARSRGVDVCTVMGRLEKNVAGEKLLNEMLTTLVGERAGLVEQLRRGLRSRRRTRK